MIEEQKRPSLGDMDLDPERGHYRLSATVPAVEANALRATLGVRPLPFSVVGALRGVVHCTGPLEEPVFSGAMPGWCWNGAGMVLEYCCNDVRKHGHCEGTCWIDGASCKVSHVGLHCIVFRHCYNWRVC